MEIMDTTDETTPPFAQPGTLHHIPPALSAFEPTPPQPPPPSQPLNTLLWTGGMFDTPLSVHYPLAIAAALPPHWTLATTTLSSAGHSWGTSSIARDAQEIHKIVAYFRSQRPGGKIAIMGHSTGCQDCMEYLIGPGSETEARRSTVDAVILQAPVSDREALVHALPEAHMAEANEAALKLVRERKGGEMLPARLSKPAFGRLAITAQRWLDVASPGPDHAGAEDFFSSDLGDERLEKTFGRLPASAPLLVLYGGADEAVLEFVDRRALVTRWMGVAEKCGGVVDGVNGGVVEGASHNLNGQRAEIVEGLVKRVVRFLGRLDEGELTRRA